jgi:hypothetical protein
MRLPRVSLSFMMFLAAIAAFQCGVLVSDLHGRPLFGLPYRLHSDFIPSTTVFGIGLFMILTDRRWRRPSLLAFVVVGCLIVVPLFDIHGVDFNPVEPRFTDAEPLDLQVTTLLFQGLMVAVPQILLAALAGFAVHVVFERSGKAEIDSSGL